MRNQVAGLVLDSEKHVHQVNIELEWRPRRFLGRGRRGADRGRVWRGSQLCPGRKQRDKPSSKAATPHRCLIPAPLDEIRTLRRAYLNGFPPEMKPVRLRHV